MWLCRDVVDVVMAVDCGCDGFGGLGLPFVFAF